MQRARVRAFWYVNELDERVKLKILRKFRKENEMAAKMLMMTELPPPSKKGQAATEPMVAIRDNGQIGFNSVLTKTLNGHTGVAVMRDGDKGLVLALIGPEKLAELSKKGAAVFGLKVNEKTKQSYFPGSQIMKAFGYDFKTAGNQSFKPEFSKDGKSIIIQLPSGTPQRKPVTPRPSRKAKAGAAAETSTAAAAAKPAPSTDDLDLQI